MKRRLMNLYYSKPLFSRWQVFTVALLSGPLPAGYLLSRNLKRSGYPKASLWARILGYFLAFLIFFLLAFIREGAIPASGGLNRLLGMTGYQVMLPALVVFHGIVAGWVLLLYRSLSQRGPLILPAQPNERYIFMDVVPWLLAGLGLIAYFFAAGTFRFVFLVVYLLPHFYLAGHLRRAISPGWQRKLSLGVFVFVLLLFPVSMLIEEDSGGLLMHLLRMAGYYYLPVLLYVLLLYLLFDIIKVVDRISGLLPDDFFNLRRVRQYALVVVLLLTTGIMAMGIHRFNHTRLHRYHLDIPARSSAMDGLTIAMAADLHLSEITRRPFVDQFVETMNAAKPDVILVVGDLVESGRSTPALQTFEKQLSRMEAPLGVYAVEGNHEHYGGNGGFDFIEDAGMKLLRDTAVVVEEGFVLVGRKDRHVDDRASLRSLLEGVPDTLPRIVMDHQPYHLEDVARQDVDLQFSGHTHHGQLWPVNYITEAIYELSRGHKKIRNTHFFVTSGAQGWGPPVKTSSRSEIMLVEVNFTASNDSQ